MALLVLATSNTQAKIYKWVNAEGTVHYTQTPPPHSATKGEQLNLRNSGTVKVRKRGKKFYCGKNQLPNVSDNAAVAISNLENNILSWRENAERTNEQRTSYIRKHANQSSYSKRLREYDKRAAENDCRIKWAQAKLENMGSERDSIFKHHKELEALKKQLESQKVAACGTPTRSGVIFVDVQYRAYRSCVRPFDRELRKLKKHVRRSGRDVKLVTED
jgi:hypothetical protein